MDPLLTSSRKKKRGGKARREEQDRLLTVEKNVYGIFEVSHSRKSHLGQEGTAEAKKGPGGRGVASENETEEQGV